MLTTKLVRLLSGIGLNLVLVASYATQPDLITKKFTIGQYTFPIVIDSHLSLEALNFQLEAPRIIHFIGERMMIGSQSGQVYWLDPPYQNAHLLTELDGYPHSVVVAGGKIYVARTNDILVTDYDQSIEFIEPAQFKKLVDLPGGQGHSSRTLKSGPDGNLYVSLGIAGNCSDQWLNDSYPFKDRRGGIFQVVQSNDPVSLLPFASGLRNPVGFDWLPDGSAIYASNNGPDHMGYEQPPEQFVRISENSFHGMPWYQYDGEKFIRDDCIDSEPPRGVSTLTVPEALFPPHNSPLDVTFLKNQEDSRYQGDAIVALHGSWATADAPKGLGTPSSRRPPKIVRVEFKDGHAIGVHDLLYGFQLEDGARWGRPAGVTVGPDGNIYFTSDGGINGLYRLRWNN